MILSKTTHKHTHTQKRKNLKVSTGIWWQLKKNNEVDTILHPVIWLENLEEKKRMKEIKELKIK